MKEIKDIQDAKNFVENFDSISNSTFPEGPYKLKSFAYKKHTLSHGQAVAYIIKMKGAFYDYMVGNNWHDREPEKIEDIEQYLLENKEEINKELKHPYGNFHNFN